MERADGNPGPESSSSLWAVLATLAFTNQVEFCLRSPLCPSRRSRVTTGPGLPRQVLVYTSCHGIIVKSTPCPIWRILSRVPYAKAGLIFPTPLAMGVWEQVCQEWQRKALCRSESPRAVVRTCGCHALTLCPSSPCTLLHSDRQAPPLVPVATVDPQSSAPCGCQSNCGRRRSKSWR